MERQAVQSSAAHKCLFNDDLLRTILKFEPYHVYSVGAGLCQPLLNIALVCKAFEEPALAELWCELKGLARLCGLLPSVQLIGNTYTMIQTGPLEAAEWVRFDRYARWVKEMFFDVRAGHPVHPSVFIRMAQEHPAPLLPNLGSLFCGSRINDALVLVGPALHRVSFESADNAAASTFLNAIYRKAPHISDVRVTLTGPFDPSVQALIQKFRAPQVILDLRNTPLLAYVELDRALAQGNCQHFGLTAPAQWELDITKQSFSVGFQTLQTLWIEGGSGVISAAVSRVQSTRVSKISVIYSTDPRGTQSSLNWRPLAHLIFGRWSACLRDIHVDFKNSSKPALITTLLGSIHLPSLQHLALTNYWPIQIGDAGVQKIGESCPNLVSLNLMAGMYHDPDGVAPSIASLEHLAAHCPLLEAVNMSLVFPVPLRLNLSPTIPKNKGFRVLGIRNMYMPVTSLFYRTTEATRAIAKFVDHILPNVQHIRSQIDCHDPFWIQVFSLVKEMQKTCLL